MDQCYTLIVQPMHYLVTYCGLAAGSASGDPNKERAVSAPQADSSWHATMHALFSRATSIHLVCVLC